jgi:anhydro-N-acetylmuramic acid kinase
MKQHIDKLHKISGQKSRRIIGLMSGTSLDGLDVALCQIENSGIETDLHVERFKTVPYTESFRDEIRKVFAKKEIDFQQLCLLNPFIGIEHGKMILECLAEWNINPSEVDLIASHGQTVFHAPKIQHGLTEFPNATLQIGDGDHIAVQTNIITLSDFRQKHIAVGGEGAPLAVYGDYFLFSKKGENRILLNMGGIANFTLLSGAFDEDQCKELPIFTTDTGPGNTLIDAYMRRFFRKPYDENGEVASNGVPNETFLKVLKEKAFFDAPFPKTTGPEVFNYAYVENAIQKSRLSSLSRNDIIATLTRLSADTIVEAISKVTQSNESYTIYASGGGAHNPVLMKAIRDQLPDYPVFLLDELGVTGDAKEAVLFAVLANEAVAGTGGNFSSLGSVPATTMGKISFPK